MTIHFGLGSAAPTGTPQPSFPSFFLNMTPGNCCYDPQRPAYWPSWSPTLTESQCLDNSNNCANAGFPVGARPTSACAGQLNADGSCTQVATINDPNNTQNQLGTSGDSYSNDVSAWLAGMQAGAHTNLPDNQPDCQKLGYTWDAVNGVCVESSGIPGWAWGLIAAVLLLATGFIGGKR